jgi:hypothetical protein
MDSPSDSPTQAGSRVGVEPTLGFEPRTCCFARLMYLSAQESEAGQR